LSKRIEVNPRILGGKPVVSGTRIPVYLILELLSAGQDFKQIVEDYPSLTKEDIRATLYYAAEIIQNEKARIIMKGKLKVKYSPDADAMVITVGSGRLDHGDKTTPGVIVHYNKNNELLEIEILDASELISATELEIAKTKKEASVHAKTTK
jgi:uncharacterized protein (DUF433 family)/uncharacterized protein YuzE